MEEKKVKKGFNLKKGALILIGILAIVLLLYAFKMELFKEGVRESATYSGNVKMDPEKGILIEVENEDGTISELTAEEVFEELDGAENLLKDDENSTKEEKLKYLLNAELVTKYPYIASLEGDESKLNGIVKFYRYTDEIEASEGEQEILEDDEDEETPQTTFNPKEVFYIGDSWMKGLQIHISANVSEEYSAANHFLCAESQRPTSPIFTDDSLKNSIDAVESEVSQIVIMLGLNGTSEKESDRMGEIIEFLSSTYPDKTIYVLKVPHVGRAYSYSESYGANELNSNIDSYNALILEVCSNLENVKYIDTTSNMMDDERFLDTPYVAQDGLHLNDKGKELWYNNIKECIILGKSSVAVSKFQMTYTDPENFDRMCRNYENDGNTEVYKYFTIDEENKIVIAYGKTITRTITTDDPEITLESVNEGQVEPYEEVGEGVYSSTRHLIRSAPYDYQSLVNRYTMPFNLLWAFLVQTENYDLTKEIADLAYQSEIVIGIYDNESTSVSNNTQTYNKALRYSENTGLTFPSPGQTTPSIDINDSKYADVVRRCYSHIEGDSAVHNTCDNAQLHQYYITDSTEGGLITAISSTEKTYTKTNTTSTISNSTPTIGVILADCWTGRWSATYALGDDTNSSTSSSSGPRDETFTDISGGKISTTLWQSPGGIITQHLTAHSEALKQEAIDQIVAATSFSNVVQANMGEIAQHLNTNCSYCLQQLQIAYGKTLQELRESGQMTQVLMDIINDKNYIGPYAAQSARKKIYNHVCAPLEQSIRNQFKEQLRNKINYSQWVTAQEAKLNILTNSSNTRIASKYEKDTVTRESEGEKFKEILQKQEYYGARRALKDGIEWFWIYIREAENTVNLEDLLRHLFNIVFDTDEFGEFDEHDIENIYKAFEPRQLVNAGGGHFYAFCQWLKSRENESLRQYLSEEYSRAYSDVERYVTEDGEFAKMYYTDFDGCWNFTYGIMVCNKDGILNNEAIFNQVTGLDLGELVERAKSGETVTVPMDDLEEIFEYLVTTKRDRLKNIAQQRDGKMEIYQYYALTNVMYQWGNCGEGIQDEDNIVEVYKKYYIEEQNPEEFRKRAVCATGGNKVAFWNNGQYTDRIEAAWILFTEGRYILSTGEEIFVTSETADLILEACEEVTQELMDNNVQYYAQDIDGDGEKETVAGLAWKDIVRSSDYTTGIGTCCATYVGNVLYKAEIFTADYINKYNYNLPGCPRDMDSIYGMLLDAGWIIVDPEDAQPGDVATFCEHNYVDANGKKQDRLSHAYIYAGGNLIWDQSTGCISGGRMGNGKPVSLWNTYLTKYDVTVFRAP